MLVDPLHIDSDIKGLGEMLSAIGGESSQPKRLSRGMYEINHFSFDHCLPMTLSFPADVEKDEGWWLTYPELGEQLNPDAKFVITEFGPFGVCDSPEQFLEHPVGKWIIESKTGYVVSFSKVVKSEQSDSGGWRWHKWGEYIGKHEPKCEYIYDEGDEIEEVYCYHVFECLSDHAIAPIEED